jgi:hypothetical protein
MVFVSKISYFCVLSACLFFKVLYAYKFIRARVLYAQNLYARAYFAYLLVYFVLTSIIARGRGVDSKHPVRLQHVPQC